MATPTVCHIPGLTPPQQPTGPAFLPVPEAHDLPSLIQAVNAIRQNLQRLQNQNTPLGKGGQSKNTPTKPNRWTEDPGSRVTTKVRVTNPNDSTQFVDVEQVTSIGMKDGITGDMWKWTR